MEMMGWESSGNCPLELPGEALHPAGKPAGIHSDFQVTGAGQGFKPHLQLFGVLHSSLLCPDSPQTASRGTVVLPPRNSQLMEAQTLTTAQPHQCGGPFPCLNSHLIYPQSLQPSQTLRNRCLCHFGDATGRVGMREGGFGSGMSPLPPWGCPFDPVPFSQPAGTSRCTGRAAESKRHQIPLPSGIFLSGRGRALTGRVQPPWQSCHCAGGALSPPSSPPSPALESYFQSHLWLPL